MKNHSDLRMSSLTKLGEMGMKYLVLLGIFFSQSAHAQTIEGIRLLSMAEPVASYLFDSLEDRIRASDSDYKPVARDLWRMGANLSSSYLYVDKNGVAVAATFFLTPEDRPISREILILLDPFEEVKSRVIHAAESRQLRYELIKRIFKLSNAANFEKFRVSTAPGDFITLAYIETLLRLKGYQSVEVLPRTTNSLSRRVLEVAGYDRTLQKRGLPSFEYIEAVEDSLIEKALRSEVKEVGGKVHIEVAYALEPNITEVNPNFCADLFAAKN